MVMTLGGGRGDDPGPEYRVSGRGGRRPGAGGDETAATQRLRNQAQGEMLRLKQCCGSGSVGSICFWASLIRIH
jgi:hypothetical protein